MRMSAGDDLERGQFQTSVSLCHRTASVMVTFLDD